MSSIVSRLTQKQLIKPPSFVVDSTCYETIMGSNAYGVSNESSDNDIYGFCIGSLGHIFPHAVGLIPGFDNPPGFKVYEQHHVNVPDWGKQYDFSIYGILHYFRLCADGNPNMIDSLFTPQRCVLYQNSIGQMVREKRKLFLSKKCWHSFKGYAYAQLHKIRTKQANKTGRQELIEKFGYDVKFAYHVVRLADECEQILSRGDLDLEASREQLKSIRRGEWKIEDIEKYFTDAETRLQKYYSESNAIPYSPPIDEIRSLLISCLEQAFGSIGNLVNRADDNGRIIQQIRELVNK